MRCKSLFEKIEEFTPKYLDIWEEVVNMESPTASKEGVDAVGAYFADMAHGRGWQVETLILEGAGNAVCITLNPSAPAAPVVFSGHIDTVHPKGLFGYPPARRDERNIYGPGVMDCKGGVVASFMALDALCALGFDSRPVRLIIQTDEETSSKNSGGRTVRFMCEHSAGAVAFLNTEGIVGNTAVLIRKGIIRYRINIHGRAVHSSRCADGANAIAEAAHKILKLEQYKDAQGLTFNCGVISGGTVVNTVAAECSFLLDIRFSDMEQCERARGIVRDIVSHTDIEGCSADCEELSFRPAMPYAERNKELLDKINGIYRENGMPELEARACLSGSDAAYVTEAGIPCVDNIGVEGKNIHSVKEYATLSSLSECACRLAAVAYCI